MQTSKIYCFSCPRLYDFIEETVTKLSPHPPCVEVLGLIERSWVQNLSNFKYTNNVVIFLEMDKLRHTYFQTLLPPPTTQKV